MFLSFSINLESKLAYRKMLAHLENSHFRHFLNAWCSFLYCGCCLRSLMWSTLIYSNTIITFITGNKNTESCEISLHFLCFFAEPIFSPSLEPCSSVLHVSYPLKFMQEFLYTDLMLHAKFGWATNRQKKVAAVWKFKFPKIALDPAIF